MSPQSIYTGPLESILADPAVTAIYVDSTSILYDRNGQTYLSDQRFADEEQQWDVISSIVQVCGRSLSAVNPVVDCLLFDGTRVHAEYDPLSITLYKHK